MPGPAAAMQQPPAAVQMQGLPALNLPPQPAQQESALQSQGSSFLISFSCNLPNEAVICRAEQGLFNQITALTNSLYCCIGHEVDMVRICF